MTFRQPLEPVVPLAPVAPPRGESPPLVMPEDPICTDGLLRYTIVPRLKLQ